MNRYCKILLMLLTLPAFLFAGFNYIVDPLQYYHQSYFSPIFFDNQRQQNPGLAKNYPYDAVVIGTSNTENFTPYVVTKYFDMSVLKLSMAGSTAYEQALILNLALATGQVKDVFWGVEHKSFNQGVYAVSDRDGGFPMHLYTGGISAIFNYLFSIDSFKLSLDVINGEGKKKLDTLNTWYNTNAFSVDMVKENFTIYCKKALNDTGFKTAAAKHNLRSDLDRTVKLHLHDIITRHPHVNFHLFFPPASMAKHYLNFKYYPDSFYDFFEFKKKVYKSVGRYDNVDIYDFDYVKEITHNLDLYKDISHYNIDVNNYILDSIKKDLNRYNVKESLLSHEKFVKMLSRYQIPFVSEC